MSLLSGALPRLYGLFDERLGQSVRHVGGNLGVARVVKNADDAAASRRHNLEVLLYYLDGVLHGRLKRGSRAGNLVEPVPETGGPEFLALIEVEFSYNLLDQSILLEDFSLRLHVSAVRVRGRGRSRIDIPEVEEILVHALDLKRSLGL